MRVCFLANFGKTVFYDGIGRALKARGHQVTWVTPSPRWNAHLIEGGVDPSDILTLSDFRKEWEGDAEITREDEARLARLELADKLTVNDMIAMDRALRLMPSQRARAYLNAVERECRAFFDRVKPDLVLGEMTWGWENMAGSVARHMGIGQFCFSSVRFPSERIAFSDRYQDEFLFPVRDAAPEDRAEAERLVDAFRARPTKPLYEITNSRIPTFRSLWLDEARALLAGHERGNPQARSLLSRLTSRGAMVINLIRQRYSPTFEAIPPEPRKPFVLVLLHVQPESTIDAYASHHTDQIDNIAMIARSLPATHEIYVKEHPSAAGDRGRDYYRRLKAIPGVRLIPPRSDTFTLMRDAWLVASVAGSASYEAGLLGVPAVAMTPLFFADLLITPTLTPKNEDPISLKAKVDAYLAIPEIERRERAVRLIQNVLRCSFPALVSDPYSNPACLDPENLEKLADGIEAVQAQRLKAA